MIYLFIIHIHRAYSTIQNIFIRTYSSSEKDERSKINHAAKKPDKYRKKKQSKARKSAQELTENQHCIGKGAEDGQKETANNTRPEDLQQQLASTRQISSRREHEVAINEYQEQVPQSSLGAGQEPIRLLTRLLHPRRRERLEKQIRWVPLTLQAIGNQIQRRWKVTTVCTAAEDKEEKKEGEVGENRFAHFSIAGFVESREYILEDISACIYNEKTNPSILRVYRYEEDT
ncbi:hypothetical protein HS088_TW19G00322 [Tripterygium wilfordii]|uniref:Uncharacterized protein n=1 Tax=Tripterygium wilfordii TaxID=458696 RepID=A0A7J7CA35_TRIWF|nr:hypothetical protein HS088_TW19G00322 [Tripterygium wilfordii]